MASAVSLTTTSLPSQAHGFTNCAYAHPKDVEALAAAAGLDPERVLKRGILCNVGDAVFLIQCVSRHGRARGAGVAAGDGRAGARDPPWVPKPNLGPRSFSPDRRHPHAPAARRRPAPQAV
jgi:hypothetical protein